MWCWHKKKDINKWSRLESLEIEPHIHGELNLNKDVKLTVKSIVFSTNGARTAGYPYKEKAVLIFPSHHTYL